MGGSVSTHTSLISAQSIVEGLEGRDNLAWIERIILKMYLKDSWSEDIEWLYRETFLITVMNIRVSYT